MTLAAAALVHPAIVLALGSVTILIIAAHLIALNQADMPPRRRRLRTINGVLMLLATPLLAFAFGYLSPDTPRLFLFVWMTAIALLGLILIVSTLDMAFTFRAQQKIHRDLARRLRDHARHTAHHQEPHS